MSNTNINTTNKTMHVYCFDTPAGKMFCAADESHVYVLAFEGSSILERRFPYICDQLGVCRIVEIKNEILDKLKDELKAYFDGTLQKFTVPMKTIGTQFQQAVWTKLQELPYGSTHTYSDFAKTMGCSASHARAIGHACANNVHLLLIPCHRVVAVGSQGGYNSGFERKEWLINHEMKHANSSICSSSF